MQSTLKARRSTSGYLKIVIRKLLVSFFIKALKSSHNQMPRVITIDTYAATKIAIIEEIYYGVLSCRAQHRMIQYLNNIIKQDHRFIKKIIKPMLGFKSFYSACLTISGIESIHMKSKGQAGTSNVTEEVALINRLFNVA